MRLAKPSQIRRAFLPSLQRYQTLSNVSGQKISKTAMPSIFCQTRARQGVYCQTRVCQSNDCQIWAHQRKFRASIGSQPEGNQQIDQNQQYFDEKSSPFGSQPTKFQSNPFKHCSRPGRPVENKTTGWRWVDLGEKPKATRVPRK